MQEVPPSITLILCAAWRRLGTLERNYICSKVAPVWCQGRVSCSHTSSRQVSELVPSMSRPCKVSKGYRKNPGRPTEIASCLHEVTIYATIFWSGSLTVAQGDMGQHSPANGLANRVGLPSVCRTVVGMLSMPVKHRYSQANHQRRHHHFSQYPSTLTTLAPFSD